MYLNRDEKDANSMNRDDIYGVYGGSGFGRMTMITARQQLVTTGVALDQQVFIDDKPSASTLHGHRVLTYDQFLAEPARNRYVVIAIADSGIREKLALRCASDGVKAWHVQAPTVEIWDNTTLGEGAILDAFVIISNDCTIGRHFHANLYSYVGHDCSIGDYVTFAPRVSCNGLIVIEDHVYIGTGAILKQGSPNRPMVIGKGAVIGMGAVVTRSVAAGTTVFGNPAQPLRRAARQQLHK